MIRPELDFYAPPINFNAANVQRRNRQRTDIYAWRASKAKTNKNMISDSNSAAQSATRGVTEKHLPFASKSVCATGTERFVAGSMRAAVKERNDKSEVNGYWSHGAVLVPDRRRSWKMTGFDFTQTIPHGTMTSLQRRNAALNKDKTMRMKGASQRANDTASLKSTYFHDTITFYKPYSSTMTTTTFCDNHHNNYINNNNCSIKSNLEYHYNNTLPSISGKKQWQHERLGARNMSHVNTSTSTLFALTCNGAELESMCANETINHDDKENTHTAATAVEMNKNGNNNNNNNNNSNSKERKDAFNNEFVKENNVRSDLERNNRQWVQRLGPILQSKHERHQVVDEFCKTIHRTANKEINPHHNLHHNNNESYNRISESEQELELEQQEEELEQHCNQEQQDNYANRVVDYDNSNKEEEEQAEIEIENKSPLSLPTAEIAYTLRPEYVQHHFSKTESKQGQRLHSEWESESNRFANTYDGNAIHEDQFMLSGRNWNRTMFNVITTTTTTNNSSSNSNNNIINDNTVGSSQVHLLPTEAKLMRLYAVNVPKMMQSSDLSMIRRQEPPRLGVKVELPHNY